MLYVRSFAIVPFVNIYITYKNINLKKNDFICRLHGRIIYLYYMRIKRDYACIVGEN